MGAMQGGAKATASVLYDDFMYGATLETTTDAAGHAHFDVPADVLTRGSGKRFLHVTAGPMYPLVEKIVALP